MRSDRGFTIIELMVTVALLALVLVIAYPALRNYWMVRTLGTASDESTTQLRQLQQGVMSESAPYVYGAWFRTGSSNWGMVRFDPKDLTNTTDGVCTSMGTRSFHPLVKVTQATFDDATTEIMSACGSAVSSATDFVFFYPRGTATGGTLKFTHDILNRTRTINVNAVTGRLSRS